MIANRFNPLGKDARKTAKAYIQDGLIAMYDGIENGGWGKHDASATAWKDLIGDRDFIVRDTTKVSFSKDSLDIAFLKYVTSPVYTDDTFSDVGVFKTIEIVANVENGSRIIFARNNMQDAIWVIQTNMTALQFAYGAGKGITGITNLCDVRHAISAIYGSSAMEVKGVYLDSINQPLTTISNTWATSGGQLSLGGRSSPLGSQNFGGSFYSIRIYDKELTEAEIAYNYAIDKERFGL